MEKTTVYSLPKYFFALGIDFYRLNASARLGGPMRKTIFWMGLAGAVCALLMFRNNVEKKTALYTIGIVQTISHPALDQARLGFIDSLHEKYGSSINFIVQNADGMQTQAQGIAKSFASNANIDGIYAIGTLAAQSVLQVENKRPLFFAAVSDPKALGLTGANKNSCGSSDASDSQKQAQLIQQFFPQAKKVALLYNPAEINSTILLPHMKKALNTIGLTAILVAVHDYSEITSATQFATRQADVLLVPPDNLLVSAMASVSNIAFKYAKAVIASDTPSVRMGALMANGIDYYESGKQAASECAVLVLQKEKNANDIGVLTNKNTATFINKARLVGLEIAIPATMKEAVQFIE